MKFNPTWPQVALFAVLLGAIILAYIFAPPAAQVVTSVVSTVVGFIFGDFKKEPEAPGPTPKLEVLDGGKQ